MKKLALTIAIVLGMSMISFAQGGGLFQRGTSSDEVVTGTMSRGDGGPAVPGTHGEEGDQPAPLGSGIAVLMGLGAAYLVGKKRREE